LRFMQDIGWLARLPKLKAIKVDEAPTMPLSKDEYGRLLATIEKIEKFPRRHERAAVHALIQLMRHTGLAIRDAVTLERNSLIQDQAKGIWRVATSRQKTGTHVSVPLPNAIAQEVLTVLNGNPRFVFWNGTSLEQSAVTDWQHDLRTLFRTAFGESTNFTPHCLRDTFAVGMLSAGVPIEEVSKLLGHTSVKTTEKSYSPWVRARQDRLDSLVVATWQAQP
jgi:integrase/recombinase XerD